MDTSIKVRGKGLSATWPIPLRKYQFKNSPITPPTVLPFEVTRLKLLYKTEFEAFKRFILLDL